MDFEGLFGHDQAFQGFAQENTTEAQNYGTELDTWDAGMKNLLANLESDVGSNSIGIEGMMEMGGENERFDVDTFTWEVLNV
jgi:hypothetical protein